MNDGSGATMQVGTAIGMGIVGGAGLIGSGLVARGVTSERPLGAIPTMLGGLALTGLGVQAAAMGARTLGVTMALAGTGAVLGAGAGLADAMRNARDAHEVELGPATVIDRSAQSRVVTAP